MGHHVAEMIPIGLRAATGRTEEDRSTPVSIAPNRHALVRQVNQRRLVDALLTQGPVSRVRLAELTGLSRPTVNAMIRRLRAAGLVRESGRTQGHVGRSAPLYSVDPLARVVLGVDIGRNNLKLCLADLFGRALAEDAELTDRSGRDALMSQLVRVSGEMFGRVGIDRHRLGAVTLASPGVFDPTTGDAILPDKFGGLEPLALDELRASFGDDVVVENNMNLAAVGERWQGLASNVDDFAFIGIGTGIGMGLVVDGRLVRGTRGLAGEIKFLPLGGASPLDMNGVLRWTLEEAAAAEGIARAFRERLASGARSTVHADGQAIEIFSAAAEGDALARSVVDGEAKIVALAVLSVLAVADPGLVVLGGQIGANPLLVEQVRRLVQSAAPLPVLVEASALGARASLVGAVAIALMMTHSRLFGTGDYLPGWDAGTGAMEMLRRMRVKE
jgi:predicted NBD/HSP70 family sugar kinase/biotin operon repressor